MDSKNVGLGLRQALDNASPLPESSNKKSGYMLYIKPSRSIIDTTDPSTEFFLGSSVLIHKAQATQKNCMHVIIYHHPELLFRNIILSRVLTCLVDEEP